MKFLNKLPKIRQWHGPKTDMLLRSPGDFGLGQVVNSCVPEATSSMICGYCSTGCSLNIHLKGKQAINITPDSSYPVNLGMACPKGWEALEPLKSEDRGKFPMIKSGNGKNFEATSWNNAMEAFCGRFKAIQKKHGKHAVAFLSTGQIVTEEMAFLGALTKFGMGMMHGDGNTRQCMATAVVAYKQSFGFDAPPYTYQDFEESDVIILIGSNLCIAHPIMWQRIERNNNNPEIVVIDPRTTETAIAATQHYPIVPKSDLIFLYGIAKILIENDWLDHQFLSKNTSGFAEFTEHLKKITYQQVIEQSGASMEQLYQLAKTIGEGKRVSFWWTMGVNQGHESTRTAQAIINLALMTGNIGRPGTGANSITGQCNAMGSRLFSNTTNLLGGHDFSNPEDRAKVARCLDIDLDCIPKSASLAYDQIIKEIHEGNIKGLWVIATNGAHSWIHQDKYREAMEKLEFLVVQDMYPTTETAMMADLYLPAAAWGEKEGVFINSERRIGLVKKVTEAPGESLSDFSIFKLVAHSWGCSEMFKEWVNPEAVFKILCKLSEGQPCDFSAISRYSMLEKHGGIQWPYTSDHKEKLLESNQRRLFEDQCFYHSDGKAKFIYADPQFVADPVSEEFPYILLTGRGTSSQWHTQTRTSKSKVLKKLYPQEVFVDINPSDSEKLGVITNDMVWVISAQARVKVKVFVTTSVRAGQLYMPMHYAKTNRLTCAKFDPHSRQPSYKYCAVNIELL